MKAAIFIGRRLSLRSESGKASSPGVITGVTGVALAIIIMLLSIAVVKGFKHEITMKIAGFNAGITIYAPENADNTTDYSGIKMTDSLSSIIESVAPEASPTLIFTEPAIFKTNTDFQGIVLKGLPPGNPWNFVNDNIIDGIAPQSDDADKNSVVISSVTAHMLGIGCGDKIITHFLDDNSVRTRNLTVTGIYDSHFHDFDEIYAFTPISLLQKLNKTDSLTGTAIELNGMNLYDTPAISVELHNRLINATTENPSNPMIFHTESVIESNALYFNWLDLLDTNVVVIIILMACVAGFTLISSLFIIILERVNTIGLLKSLGAPNAMIRRIFIYMAERLVIKGMIIGNAIALALISTQRTWHILPLDPDAYYLNYVPMELDWISITAVNGAVLLISALILILPSHMISKLSPAESLRFE